MKSASLFTSGTISPDDATPCLLPSFNSGAVTATQSGFTVTVTCANPHLMSTTASVRIHNFGVKIYFKVTGGAIKADINDSGWYTDLFIVDANTFTCKSTISATVGSQTVTANGGLTRIAPMQLTVPANTLTIGSSIQADFLMEFPTTGAGRSSSYSINPSTYPGQSAIFSNVNITNIAENSRWVQTNATFLSNSADSDFVTYNTLGAAAASKKVAVGAFIDLTKDWSLQLWFNFGAIALNDYCLLTAARMLVVR